MLLTQGKNMPKENAPNIGPINAPWIKVENWKEINKFLLSKN